MTSRILSIPLRISSKLLLDSSSTGSTLIFGCFGTTKAPPLPSRVFISSLSDSFFLFRKFSTNLLNLSLSFLVLNPSFLSSLVSCSPSMVPSATNSSRYLAYLSSPKNLEGTIADALTVVTFGSGVSSAGSS